MSSSGTKRRAACASCSRAGCTSATLTSPARTRGDGSAPQHLPADAPLGAAAPPRRRAGGGRHGEDRMAHVLFSAAPDDVGLYGKPMARNAQIWTQNCELLLDGPRAGRADLIRAAEALQARRAVRLPVRVPTDACRPVRGVLAPPAGRIPFAADRPRPRCLRDAPSGYPHRLPGRRPRLGALGGTLAAPARPGELPARDRRLPTSSTSHPDHQAALNVRKLLDTWRAGGRPAAAAQLRPPSAHSCPRRRPWRTG